MFDNLKIAITDQIQLESVCDVLESMGYQKYDDEMTKNPTVVEAYEDGIYCLYSQDLHVCKTINLTDLMALRDKKIKEKIGA